MSERKKYILIDAMNMMHRAKHVVHRGDIDTRIGMAMHIMFNSLRKGWRDLGGDHIVYCLEGRSWRKDSYAPYKANRVIARLKKNQREQVGLQAQACLLPRPRRDATRQPKIGVDKSIQNPHGKQ